MPSDEPAPQSATDSSLTHVSRWAVGKRLVAAIAPAGLIVLIAIASLFSVCRAESDVASPPQWEAAAEFVRLSKANGELIVFAPEWSDPIGRQYLGDQMTIKMAARMDSARYSGIWELSLDGASAPEVSGLTADVTQSFGPLEVRHYMQTPVVVSYDFTAEWKSANVVGRGRPQFGLQEVGFEPHRCVLVVPQPNQTVSLQFASAQLGQTIVGYVGLADIFTRRKIRDPGHLELLIDGQVKAAVTAGVDDGWVRFSAETTPGQASVEFRLTAVGENAQNRRICFAAEARQ